MSEQTSFIEAPPPYVPHSEPSRQAATAMLESLPRLQFRVLEVLQSAGQYGATDEELQALLGMNPSTERPRRIELVNKRLVIDSGIVRRTRSGRNATVWRVA